MSIITRHQCHFSQHINYYHKFLAGKLETWQHNSIREWHSPSEMIIKLRGWQHRFPGDSNNARLFGSLGDVNRWNFNGVSVIPVWHRANCFVVIGPVAQTYCQLELILIIIKAHDTWQSFNLFRSQAQLKLSLNGF